MDARAFLDVRDLLTI